MLHFALFSFDCNKMEDNNDNTAAGEGGESETNSVTKNKGNQNFF